MGGRILSNTPVFLSFSRILAPKLTKATLAKLQGYEPWGFYIPPPMLYVIRTDSMTYPPASSPHRWDTSTRRKTEPAEYKRNRALAIERDLGRCQEFMRDGTQCTDRGTECDHIVSLANGGDDSLDNLRMLCKWHHARKTSREGQDARKTVSMYRPKPKHPGIID